MLINRYRDLTIWKLGKDISLTIYKLTKTFPRDEQFGIVSQMRRAAISIPSNIAEGFNRFSKKDFNRFLLIALGSCAELSTQIEISHDLKMLPASERDKLIEQINHEERMITSLINKNSTDGVR